MTDDAQYNLWQAAMEAAEKIKALNAGWTTAERTNVEFTNKGQTVTMDLVLAYKDETRLYNVSVSAMNNIINTPSL